MAHSSCSNSSNISGNLNVRSITNSGARLMMTHAITGFSGGRVSDYIGDDGVTAGDAIRYDVIEKLPDGTDSPSYQKYRKAQADAPENSEIVGVIESIDDGIVNVVLSGQMIYPSNRLISATHIDETLGTSGATGGNDIYFLSEVTAGAIQNLAPNIPTRIAKPILQQAGDGTYTHHVVNYIGYQIGGQIVVTNDDVVEDLTMRNNINVGGGIVPNLASNQWFADRKNFAPMTTDDMSYNQHTGKTFTKLANGKLKNNPFGARYIIEVTTTPLPTSLDKKIYGMSSTGERIWTGTIRKIDGKKLHVETVETTSPPSVKYTDAKGNNYEYVSSYQSAVALPRIKNTSNTSGTKIDGSSVTLVERTVIQARSDQGEETATIPGKINVQEATVDSLKASSTTNVVENVADAIATLASELADLKKSVHGKEGTDVTAIENVSTTK